MNYELAKKLYDEKFPIGRFVTQTTTGSDEIKVIETPTLSELIEACGDSMQMLSRIKVEGIPMWAATDTKIHKWALTPEEAVANLWLALNK